MASSNSQPPVFLAFFGGAGDGPGLFHSQIVKGAAAAGFKDPRKIGLGGATVENESTYIEWSDAAFGRKNAKNKLSSISEKCLTSPIVIVGHSYGAEAAFRTVSQLSTTVTHLVTIDAVSWQSKISWDAKPSNVSEWTNVYVSGFTDITDVIALVGGQWKHRNGADRNIDAAKHVKPGGGISHAMFSAMWTLAVPYVRKSIGI